MLTASLKWLTVHVFLKMQAQGLLMDIDLA